MPWTDSNGIDSFHCLFEVVVLTFSSKYKFYEIILANRKVTVISGYKHSKFTEPTTKEILRGSSESAKNLVKSMIEQAKEKNYEIVEEGEVLSNDDSDTDDDKHQEGSSVSFFFLIFCFLFCSIFCVFFRLRSVIVAYSTDFKRSFFCSFPDIVPQRPPSTPGYILRVPYSDQYSAPSSRNVLRSILCPFLP